jgi:hypothetical protein
MWEHSSCGGGVSETRRAITILHELGHFYAIVFGERASDIVGDRNDQAQSEANSKLIEDNCF